MLIYEQKGQQLLTLAIGPAPNQPENVKFPKRAFGKRNRAFQSVWFKEFPWLHYLDDTDVVLCHTCARADEKKLLFSVRNADRCFLSEGFSNWKKAIEKFREHQESRCHRAATESMIELPKKCRDVAEIHSDKLTEQKQLNRRIFVKVLQNTQFFSHGKASHCKAIAMTIKSQTFCSL